MKTSVKFSLSAIVMVASTFLFSCTKENDSPEITYQVTSSSSIAPIIGSPVGGTLQWNGGYASVVEIEFEAENNNNEIEFKSTTKQKIDLFVPLSNLGIIAVAPGTYEDIEYELEVQPNGNESALLLNGSYTNSNEITTPVLFKLDVPLEIESKQSNIVISDGASLTALTTLNLSLITTGVTETMLNNAVRTNGVIEITATSNVDIYSIIFDNLRNCGGVEVEN